MMSASEGEGGSWKSGRSKGGCEDFKLHISSKCGQGRGSKNLKILRMSLTVTPYCYTFVVSSRVQGPYKQETTVTQSDQRPVASAAGTCGGFPFGF